MSRPTTRHNCRKGDLGGGTLNAYFFGRHDGTLPTHLLRDADAEHGIWAIGPLEGAEHNVYYAASVPESATLDSVTDPITDAGTAVTTIVIQCISADCMRMVMDIIGIV